jgi:hypothetical protein
MNERIFSTSSFLARDSANSESVRERARWPTEDDENKYKIVPLMPKKAL